MMSLWTIHWAAAVRKANNELEYIRNGMESNAEHTLSEAIVWPPSEYWWQYWATHIKKYIVELGGV